MLSPTKKIGEILVKKGLITIRELQDALAEQEKTHEFLGQILIKKNLIKEKDLLDVLSEQFNLPLVNLKNKYIDWQTAKSFSASLILDYGCLPLEKDDVSVTMAINNPLDMRVIKKAEEEAGGLKLKLVLASREDLKEAILRYQQYLKGEILKLFK